MLSIQSVYSLCQPLTDSYIAFSHNEFEKFKEEKHQSCYDPIHDMICITIPQIKQQADYHNIPVPRILLYILLHEIGHSLDPNVHTEKDVIKLETTAWDIADYLMGELKLPKTKEYFRVREYALSSHKERVSRQC